MERTHLKELRRRKGLTAEELAERIGVSQGHMSRIENGTRGLSVAVAEALASVLEVDTPTVLGLSKDRKVEGPPPGLREDAEPYSPGPAETLPVQPRRRETIDPWRIRTNAVDQMGIRAGDIAFVDISAEAVENVKPLQAVIAQVYDPRELTKATTVLRQFVPPSLLITNSTEKNELPIDLRRGDVAIKGVIVSVHREM